MTRTVIVTGSSGFIGSHLVDRILEKTDWEVVAVSRHARAPQPRVRPRIADLRFPVMLPKADVVFSVAASVDVPKSISEPLTVFNNNAAVASTVVEYARQHDPLVVHVTTAEVFGPGGPFGLYESARPSNPYAASKAAQDAIFSAAADSYGVRYVSARTANVFGERQPENRFVPTIVRSLLGGEPVRLFGQAKRRWIHIRDVADALIALAEDPHDANVTGADLLNNAEIVEGVGRRLGIVPTVEIVPVERTGQESVYDVAPVGMPISDDLEAGLDRAVAWFAR